jgi:peptide/nickel transport system substrate-binding protein
VGIIPAQSLSIWLVASSPDARGQLDIALGGTHIERHNKWDGLLSLGPPLLLSLLYACGPTPTQEPTPIPEEPIADPTPTRGGRLVYGLTLTPSGIDPHVDASSELGIPLTSVYDTLVYQDLDGSFVPGLAERWEVSEDGLVYTFFLNRQVKFHDDTPFDARAVQFNLERIASPETNSR